MTSDEPLQRVWEQLPGAAALLSSTGVPLVATSDWLARWTDPPGQSDWRHWLDEDSRCRLLNALAQARDFDIPLEALFDLHTRSHWRCIGWWDPRQRAHACQFIDITSTENRRRADNRESERIHLLFDQLPTQAAYFSPPPASTCLFANDSFARNMGFDRQAIVGLPAREILSPEDRQLVKRMALKYWAGGERAHYEQSRRDSLGRMRHYEVSWAADRDDAGRTRGTFVLMADVTARHLAEASLRASQERLARFVEASAEGVFIHRDGVIVDANPAACRLLSLAYEDLVGRSVLSLPPEARRASSNLRIDSGVDTLVDTEMIDGRGQVIAVELVGRSMGHKDDRHRMTIMRDVRDRQAAQARIHALIEDLRSQKERAEAADRAKSVFLAAASHDLRQPIHAMGLFLCALRTIAHTPGTTRSSDLADICRRMQSSLDGLGQLLNMLLDVSRLDANAVQVQPAPTALNPLFIEIEQQFADIAHENGLRLHVAPCSAWVHTDATVLRRILSNLMANAVRYTPRGRVLLGARRRRHGHIEIQVCDSGIGIAPEQLEAIFGEFYQIDASRTGRDETHGLGLGLSIVKRSARLIGAELHVRSIPGRGSVFSVSVPACAPAHDTHDTHDTQAPAPSPAPDTPGQRNVLVIDDDPQVLLAMQHLLQVWGHRVWCASSADEAVVLAIEHTREIDLLLSDYRLGGNTTAVQAIAAVHACLGRSVPTFILTGDTSPQRILEASELGFPLMHKPVNANALMAALAA